MSEYLVPQPDGVPGTRIECPRCKKLVFHNLFLTIQKCHACGAYIVTKPGQEIKLLETFTCPDCGMESHSPDDAREGYCGKCKGFTRHPYSFDEMLVMLLALVKVIEMDGKSLPLYMSRKIGLLTVPFPFPYSTTALEKIFRDPEEWQKYVTAVRNIRKMGVLKAVDTTISYKKK